MFVSTRPAAAVGRVSSREIAYKRPDSRHKSTRLIPTAKARSGTGAWPALNVPHTQPASVLRVGRDAGEFVGSERCHRQPNTRVHIAYRVVGPGIPHGHRIGDRSAFNLDSAVG